MTRSIFSRPPPQKPDRNPAEPKRIFANLSRIVSISPRSAKRPWQSPELDRIRVSGEFPTWRANRHAATAAGRRRCSPSRTLPNAKEPHDRDGRLSVPARRGRRPPGNPRPEFPARLVPSPDILAQKRAYASLCNAAKARVPPESPDRFGHRSAGPERYNRRRDVLVVEDRRVERVSIVTPGRSTNPDPDRDVNSQFHMGLGGSRRFQA